MRRVLVVDDDPTARSVVGGLLAQENLEVVTAEHGLQALQRLEEAPPDLVILDLMMPVMDGMTFLGRLRELPRFAALPVVVVTAKDLTVQELRGLEAGVTAVLRKGDQLKADLAAAIRAILSARPRFKVKVRKVVADMVPRFLEARREELAFLRAALERADFAGLRTSGHNMKGVGSAYGFDPISDIGRRLEEAAGASDPDAVRREIAALEDYLARVDVVTE
jgi:CheY-like chemotaxis protein